MAFDPDIALNKDFKVKVFYVYGGLPSAPDLGESLKRLCAPHQFLLSTAIYWLNVVLTRITIPQNVHNVAESSHLCMISQI